VARKPREGRMGQGARLTRKHSAGITYAVDLETGLVVSRFKPSRKDGKHEPDQLAWPVLQYQDMVPENHFTAGLKLEKMDLGALVHASLRWTKKIPVSIKNQHRGFWGMKPLKTTTRQRSLPEAHLG
jgi:hypothetical protein